MKFRFSIATSVFVVLLSTTLVFAASGVKQSDESEPSLAFPLVTGKTIEQASADGSSALAVSSKPQGPEVSRAVKSDLSIRLEWMPYIHTAPAKIAFEVPNRKLPKGLQDRGPVRDRVVQDSPFSTDISVTPNIPATSVNFEGIANQWGVYPPDTNGAVGTNHYIQTVNLGFAIWNKTGTIAQSVRNTNTLWSGFGGPCQNTNNGDPIVLHDQFSDRWLISQFALPNYPSGPFYQCIAISQTSNPLGAWHRYAFLWRNGTTDILNDYPHFGVWRDGYYMTVNEFIGCSGAGVAAFERDQMLVGNAGARMVAFHCINDGGQLPADIDGNTLPPAGTPNYIADWEFYNVHIWKFHVDWNNTGNSTFTSFANVPVATFDNAISCGSGRDCIPQPNTAEKLDAITDRYMFRLAYRNFGTHESLIANHTVDVDTNHAGIRWYEVRNLSGTPTLYQQGTYAPDANHRWMGSIAQDQSGNMALGYSVSSSSLFPSIRYTGRLAGDPLGTMPQGEATIQGGGGSQTGTGSRWGDYSAMSIDPVDDCTFWYTTEYYQTTSTVNWRTRIAAFKYSTCGGGGGNTPPIASFTYNCTGLDCNFTDTSTDPGGSIASRSWNFGDGGTSTVQNPIHSYASSGTRTVTLTVTDNGGLQDSDAQSVTVSSGGGTITLSTRGYKVKGVQKADLTWSGATGANVDVYRNNVLIYPTLNDGFQTDPINKKGSGTYTYKVCLTGTSTCSNDSTVVF